MIGGFTKLLEAVDQRAEQMAVNAGSDEATVGGVPEATPAREAPEARPTLDDSSQAFPSPIDSKGAPLDASIDATQHHRQLAAVLSAKADADRRQEREQLQRDNAMMRLQRDYDAATSAVRDLTERDGQHAADIAAVTRRADDAVHAGQAAGERAAAAEEQHAAALEHAEHLEGAVHEAQHVADAQRQEHEIVAMQKKQLDAQLFRLNNDFADHKAKTALIMADRDQQLERLKTQVSTTSASGDGEISGSAAAKETEGARREIVQLKAAAAQAAIAQAAAGGQLTEALQSAAAARSELQAVTSSVADARHASRVAQSMYDGELLSHQSTRSKLEAVIREKEDEVRALEKRGPRGGAATSPTDAGGSDEWERRAKDLAELVMEKQAALEAKRSEADQWRSRHDMAQQRIREMELVTVSVGSGAASSSLSQRGIAGGHRAVLIDDGRDGDTVQGDFGRSRFFGGLSRRGAWGQGVSQAARQIDSTSLHIGSYLRANSVLRVCVLIYIVLLHLWAFMAIATAPVPHGGATEPKV
jgi:hypothetical protein